MSPITLERKGGGAMVVPQILAASTNDKSDCAGGTGYIPFHMGEFEMLYRTPWTITHTNNVRAALKAGGFELGIPSHVNCGFQYQYDAGGRAYYLGKLYGREVAVGKTTPWNATALDDARNLIVRHPAVIEKCILALPFMLIFLAIVAYCVTPCIKTSRKAKRDRKASLYANGNGNATRSSNSTRSSDSTVNSYTMKTTTKY